MSRGLCLILWRNDLVFDRGNSNAEYWKLDRSRYASCDRYASDTDNAARASWGYLDPGGVAGSSTHSNAQIGVPRAPPNKGIIFRPKEPFFST